MNKIKISNSSKPITKKDIEDFESKYDFIFPDEYKDLVKVDNIKFTLEETIKNIKPTQKYCFDLENNDSIKTDN